jgi:hypothetical protein
VPTPKPTTTRFISDAAERAIATYGQSLAGLLLASNLGVSELEGLSVLNTAVVSLLPALLSIVKSLFASTAPFGDASASLLKVGYEIIKVIQVPVETKPTKRVAPKKAVASKPVVKPKPAAKTEKPK